VRCRLQIQRIDGLWYWAEYSTFSISDEVGLYQLTVDGYSGDAGDAMRVAQYPAYVTNGRLFSTPDSDNDVWGHDNCAMARQSGWWYGSCSTSDLNKEIDGFGMWVTGTPVSDVQASHMLLKSY